MVIDSMGIKINNYNYVCYKDWKERGKEKEKKEKKEDSVYNELGNSLI